MASFSPRTFSDVIALEAREPQAMARTGCAASDAAGRASRGPQEEVPADAWHLSIMITRRCNMSCAHCSVESSPKIKGDPDAAELIEVLREAHRNGVRSILLTGGEPMLRENLVMEMLLECQRLGLMSTVTSNGFWGKSPERAHAVVTRFKALGMRLLTISYDRYHADFQGVEPTLNIARAAAQAKLTLNISITRTLEEDDLERIVAPFEGVPNANLRFYDVQPLGRARDFDQETLRAQSSGFCSACNAPALTDDGRITACNGPAYFAPASSVISVGALADEPLSTLMHRHRHDAILETIRTQGPQWMLGELRQMPGFESWGRAHYSGMCDICLHLNSDQAALTALRAHLEQPHLTAQRAARRMVMEASWQSELRRDEVNGLSVSRVWWHALRDLSTLDGHAAQTTLGRADLDWHAQLSQLSQCGLAGALAPVTGQAVIERWAPKFWRDQMGHCAMIEAMRTFVQRDAIVQLAQIARELGVRGTLLKGGALLALDAQTSGQLPVRACCDLDVHFHSADAPRVHARLIELGYRASADESTLNVASGHQLPPLGKGAVSIEIHQTLLPAFCGLPEATMLRTARALKAPALRGLRVMRPEAMILHAILHCSKHGWSHGMKAAHDVAWLCERFPDLNWRWLARLVARTGMKRGFWTPFTVLARELELPVPASFLRHAPDDWRARKLNRLARFHLFLTGQSPWEHNPWICHPLYACKAIIGCTARAISSACCAMCAP